MAQCIECVKFGECDYLEHPSNESATETSYHNCQDFQPSEEALDQVSVNERAYWATVAKELTDNLLRREA